MSSKRLFLPTRVPPVVYFSASIAVVCFFASIAVVYFSASIAVVCFSASIAVAVRVGHSSFFLLSTCIECTVVTASIFSTQAINTKRLSLINTVVPPEIDAGSHCMRRSVIAAQTIGAADGSLTNNTVV